MTDASSNPKSGESDLPEGLSEEDLTLGANGEQADPEPVEADANPSLASSAGQPSAEVPGSVEGLTHPAWAHAHEGEPTWDDFVQGWQLGVYRDPIICGGFAGAVLALLGVFIVLRRAVFVTAAVSEGAALGVALSFFVAARFSIELPPVLGALLLALIATATLALPAARMRLPKESLVGFAYLAAAGLAVLVGDRITQEAHNVASILFGTAVMVRPLDLYLVTGVGTVVVIVLAVAYRGLLFSGFDPDSARVQGLPVKGLELTLWLLVACMVSVATRAIGALPVFAFAVLPAMAALSVSGRMRRVLWLAPLIGGLAGTLGYLFAFFFEFPVGASQTVLATAAFVVTMPVTLMRRARG